MAARTARKPADELDESLLLEATVGPRTLCAFLGVTERQLGNLVTAGVVPAPRARGKYDLAASVRCYIRSKSDPADAPGNKKLAEQRARLVAAKADAAEMEQKRLRGALVPAEEIATGWTAILQIVRQNFLALPRRAAPIVALMSKPAEIETFLRERVCEVLESAASTRFVGVGAAHASPGVPEVSDDDDLD